VKHVKELAEPVSKDQSTITVNSAETAPKFQVGIKNNVKLAELKNAQTVKVLVK
jgi:hypothetical protein